MQLVGAADKPCAVPTHENLPVSPQELHRTHVGASPGITLSLQGVPPVPTAPRGSSKIRDLADLTGTVQNSWVLGERFQWDGYRSYLKAAGGPGSRALPVSAPR